MQCCLARFEQTDSKFVTRCVLTLNARHLGPVGLQTIEIHVRREDEAKYYSNLDVRQRVHVQVDASEMMPFNKDEIDSSPLG